MNYTGRLIRTWFISGIVVFILGTTEIARAQTWIELSPTGTPPDPVYAPKPVHYDVVNNRLIVFFPGNPPYGGFGNQVWVLTNANGLGGTPAWIQLSPSGSPPFTNGLNSVVYDAANNRLIVYGGCFANCSPALANVFVLSNANGLGGPPVWTQSTVTNPQARDAHSAVFDSANNRMISFGGSFAFFGTDQNDTRILSNANGVASPSTWTTLATSSGLPGVRENHTAIYDQASNRMTIFGGNNAISTCCPYVINDYNDTWVLANANGQGGTPTWTQLSPMGMLPPVRSGHSAVYDSVNNRMLIFGGSQWNQTTQNDTRLGDLWQLSNANGIGGTPTWTQLVQLGTSPGPRVYQTAAFDQANQRMIVLGGRDATDTPSNRVWVLDFKPPSCVIPPTGLVSWWSGDGHANDLVGGNHGTLQNGASFAPGLAGQAFQLDGIDDVVTIPNSPNLSFGPTSPITVDTWVFRTSANSVLHILGKRMDCSGGTINYQMAFDTSLLVFNHDFGGVIAPAILPLNTWTHLAATFDGFMFRFYINGNQIATAIGTMGPTNAAPLLIGGSGGCSTFGGLIDEVEIFNRALTASEIQSIFNAGSAGKCKNTAPVAACQNVTITADASCTAAASINNGSYDPEGDALTITQSPAGPYPLGMTKVTLTVTDSKGASSECSATVMVTNPAPTVTINSPASGAVFAVGTPVNFAGSFTDNPGTHTATWMFDALTQAGTVNEMTGAVNATYTFTTPGVYKVKLMVDDGCGGSGTASTVGGFDALVVIYDPNGGFVTGGGWINSPAGAYTTNPALTGKANFGFVSKYHNGASIPTGQTEFQFKVANFNFQSSRYDWLVVAGARAQYKGIGTINGAGSYNFLLTVIDGQISGGGGSDKFRIKIWDAGGIIYDNQMGAGDNDNPTTVLGGGSIVIHK